MAVTHADTSRRDPLAAGSKVVLILEDGKVINATIREIQIESEIFRATKGPDNPDGPDNYETWLPTGLHHTTLTLDVEL